MKHHFLPSKISWSNGQENIILKIDKSLKAKFCLGKELYLLVWKSTLVSIFNMERWALSGRARTRAIRSICLGSKNKGISKILVIKININIIFKNQSMKKIHDKHSMKILQRRSDKGSVWSCLCMILTHFPHPNSGPVFNKTLFKNFVNLIFKNYCIKL